MSLAKENEKLKEHLETISAEMVEVRNEILDKNRLLRTLGKKKKNSHYTRYITPKRVTSGWTHLHGLVSATQF